MFAAGPQSTITYGVRMFATNAVVRIMGLASSNGVGAYAWLRDYLLLAVLAGLISALTVVGTRDRTRRRAAPSSSVPGQRDATPASPRRLSSRSPPTLAWPFC
jgi:hypothetical protein